MCRGSHLDECYGYFGVVSTADTNPLSDTAWAMISSELTVALTRWYDSCVQEH